MRDYDDDVGHDDGDGDEDDDNDDDDDDCRLDAGGHTNKAFEQDRMIRMMLLVPHVDNHTSGGQKF